LKNIVTGNFMAEKRLLLISGGKSSARALYNSLAGTKEVLLIPYALSREERDGAARDFSEGMGRFGLRGLSIHQSDNPQETVKNAQAIYIHSGNTYRLLLNLYKHDLIEVIRNQAQKGIPIIGSSAGSGVMGPTVKTTNDWAIVECPSIDALNLVPFQINPHYPNIYGHSDPDKLCEREYRIKEYHEENDTPVIGLRDEAHIEVRGDHATVQGANLVKLFQQNQMPMEMTPGQSLDFLL
jgi:dipeptidase E